MLCILLHWLFQNPMFEEAEPEFQTMAFFKTKIGIRNALQVSLVLGHLKLMTELIFRFCWCLSYSTKNQLQATVVFNISVHLTWFRMSWSRGSGRTRRPCWSHWPAPSYWPSPWPSTKVRKLPGTHDIYAVRVMNVCPTHILCCFSIQLYWSGWTTRMLMSTGLNKGWLSIQR